MIVTVAERKEAEARRRARAADHVVEELRSYARAHGGRFVVFGSFLSGRMRHDSDLDILIDVPAAERAAAWRYVESLCSEAAIEADIHDAATSRPDFIARVSANGRTLE